MSLNPSFTTGGKNYEIKRTRYLQAKYDEITKEARSDPEMQKSTMEGARLADELKKISEKYEEAQNDYFDDVTNDEKKAKYNAFKDLYKEAYDQFVSFEAETKALQTAESASIDALEEIVIEALREQCSLAKDSAKEVWCSYVDEIGKENAVEWLTYMGEALFGQEETDNPFLSKMRANREARRQNQTNGIRKIKG